MAQLQRFTIFDSGYIELPAGTTAERPASPSAGMVRYNTTTKMPEFYNGEVWASMFAGPGMSPINPAHSAEEIQTFNPEAQNGYYWIRQVGATAFQHYCIFTKVSGDPIEGGPWTVPLVTTVLPENFSNTGTTALDQYQAYCRAVGVETAGRGLETSRPTADAYGGWLATKLAVHQITNGLFVFGKSSASGGVLTMPMLNINGEGGSSDHRIVCNRTQSATVSGPNESGDACNANQLFCGWWGGTDITGWSRYDDTVPGPEDWAPANVRNTSYGGGGLQPYLVACTYN
jgi:hypothetical protein